jgi:hypothetical protein
LAEARGHRTRHQPQPLDDLIFHGGKIVPQMEFQNVFLGGQDSWQASDIDAINTANTMAMQDRKLNNVVKQFFVGIPSLTCDPRPSLPPQGEEDLRQRPRHHDL